MKHLKLISSFVLIYAISVTEAKWKYGSPDCVKRPFEDKVVNDRLRAPSCALPVEQLPGLALHRRILPPEDNIMPEWYNPRLYAIGQKLAKKHHFAVFLAPIATFSMFSSTPLTTPLLVNTGRTDTAYLSNKRYLATMLVMKFWYEDALDDKKNTVEDMNPYFIDSMYKVRGIHWNLNKNYSSAGEMLSNPRPRLKNAYKYDNAMWTAIRKDFDQSPIPQEYRKWPKEMRNIDWVNNPPPVLNQLNLLYVAYFLGGPQVILPENFGIHGTTEEELEGWNHLWAVISYAIGMEDQFNVFLQPDMTTAKAYYREMHNRYFLPSIFQAANDDTSTNLHEAFYRGFIQSLLGDTGDQLLSVDQLMLLCYETCYGIPMPNLRATMNIPNTLLRGGLSQSTNLLSLGSIRSLINNVVGEFYFHNGAKNILGVNSKDWKDVSENSYVV